MDLFPGTGTGQGAGKAGARSEGAVGGVDGGGGKGVEGDSFEDGDGEWITHGIHLGDYVRVCVCVVVCV